MFDSSRFGAAPRDVEEPKKGCIDDLGVVNASVFVESRNRDAHIAAEAAAVAAFAGTVFIFGQITR